MEPGYGKKQLVSCKKGTSAGTGMNYGNLVFRDTDFVWKKGTSAAVQPFGFNQVTELLTLSRNELTGVVTSTRGTTDAATEMSVAVAGRIEVNADGAIDPFAYVMPSSNHPLTHVAKWNGTNGNAIIGIYIGNVTQFTNPKDPLPSAADDDVIKIDFPAYGKAVAT